PRPPARGGRVSNHALASSPSLSRRPRMFNHVARIIGVAGTSPGHDHECKRRKPKMLPTCLVGSYPQPEWLIDRVRLSKQVPRVRAPDLWLVAPDKLEAAQDDATLLAIRDQERAGVDIVSDGEQRRESYSNHFATALDGVDIGNPGTTMSRMG